MKFKPLITISYLAQKGGKLDINVETHPHPGEPQQVTDATLYLLEEINNSLHKKRARHKVS